MRLTFKNEIKKAFRRKYLIAFVLIALVLQMFLQFGRLSYIDNIENKKSLQKIEEAKVSSYVYFRQFATHGITLMFIPSYFGIFYNDSNFELLVCNTNISFIFDIDSPKKGKELFVSNSPFLNFMGISLLFIFYFGIVYGKDTTINKDYLKFLSNRSGSKKCLWFILFFRLILLNAAFLLMFVINISVLLLNNINLFQAPLVTFFWGMILLTAVSFAIGCILGTVKSNFTRNTAFFVIYVVSAILLVLLLNFFTKINSGDIKPVFEFDIENLEAVMNEEEVMLKKHGPLALNKPPTEEIIKDARKSLFKYNEKICANLDRLKSQLISKIKTRKFIASLFPTLFYFSICEDASTNSYDRFIDFFNFSLKRKQEFVQFSVDNIYPLPEPEENENPDAGMQSTGNNRDSQAAREDKSNQNDQPAQPTQNTHPVPPKIENFIKDNEDLFFAQSKLPRNFWLGSIISILWIAGFLFAAYRRTLKQIEDEPGDIRDFEVEMKSDEFNYLLTAHQGLKNQVYNYFTGNGITNIIMTLDAKVLDRKDIEFIYVYETERFLKDVDRGCLYKELMGKKMPGDVKPWEYLVKYAEDTKKILLLDNFFIGMDIKDIEEFIDEVKKKEILALYIGEDYFQAINLDDHLIFCIDDMSIPGIAEKVKAIKNKK
ncbi:MAG: hypothetical protein PVH61_36605 [Candidatus Aminicenantes bacterium]|jgi:hypothetical protein